MAMRGQIIVGDVEITAVTDAEGAFPMKLDVVFPGLSQEKWRLCRRDYPEAFVDLETWHLHVGCFVLRAHDDVVLVDTGVGAAPPVFFGEMKGDLLQQLSLADVRPEDVTKVFLTHAHPDHVGWNLDSEGQPTFPNARYVLSRTDWEAFHRPEVQQAFQLNHVQETLTPLEKLGVLDLADGETPLTDEIVAVPAPGHTPGHMVVNISSRGQKAMILGDVLGHPVQVSEPELAFIFDMDPEQAIATRKKLLGRLEMDAMTAAQCHLPPPGFGLVVRTEGLRHWQPLERPD
jgi:glyoxylase-like metal-dependent hydrolase (beta-lactamase superfamily II)